MKKRNSDFKGTPVIIPDPLSPHWPIAGFKHLRPEHNLLLPKVTLVTAAILNGGRICWTPF
jgi:hypothetical protein